jgi:vitamin K-dependent gamma-carboxylase
MKSKYWSRLVNYLYQPVDIASLAVMRILFGIIIMVEAFRYVDLVRIFYKFNEQTFYFKFRYFEWVKPLSIEDMQLVFILYGISGILITLGLFYRLATLTAAFCISYIFLVDATNYLNHFYLVIIFSFMMFFIPCHRAWSLDALIYPKKAQETIANWAIWLVRAQLVIVYSYAAIAKMNVDWINGMPLYNWIGDRAHNATGWEAYLSLPMVIYFFTYGGLLYDLLAAPLLLMKKTRIFGFFLTLFFHLTNYFLFNIGIFPWFMIATTPIFFDPDWPRKVLNYVFKNRFLPIEIKPLRYINLDLWQKAGLFLLIFHISFQALFPLRHFAYPGYVGWDEAGHNFSWHMKLRGKNGIATFTVVDPDTKKTVIIDNSHYLTERQDDKMATRPWLLLQFAHFLSKQYTMPGEKPAEVYVQTKLKVNGRKYQRLVDPKVNLAEVKMTETAPAWVFPMRQPVWNATNKKNRFGEALKKDDIAMRAIPSLRAQKEKEMAFKK